MVVSLLKFENRKNKKVNKREQYTIYNGLLFIIIMFIIID